MQSILHALDEYKHNVWAVLSFQIHSPFAIHSSQILQILFCFQDINCNLTYSKYLWNTFLKAQSDDYIISWI